MNGIEDLKNTIGEDHLKQLLDYMEQEAYNSTGIRYISGGFASADKVDDNGTDVAIRLKWGIQSNCQDVVHTELYYVPWIALCDPYISTVQLFQEYTSSH